MTGIFIQLKPILLIIEDAYLYHKTKGFVVIGNITVNAEPIEDLKLMAAYTILNLKRFLSGSNASLHI
jgi:hypothetical protein